MNEADALRKTLNGEALAACASLGIPLKLPNNAFKHPTNGAIWGEFWYKTGKTVASMGEGESGWEKTAGLLQFTLYAPENSGDGPLLKLGGRLKPYFHRKQFPVEPDGYVSLDPVDVQCDGTVRNGNYAVVVDATFDFFHRNAGVDDSA